MYMNWNGWKHFTVGKIQKRECRPACRFDLGQGITMAYHDRSQGLSAACREVDIVVMPFYKARYPCAAVLYDKPSFGMRVHRQLMIRNGELVTQTAPSTRLWQN